MVPPAPLEEIFVRTSGSVAPGLAPVAGAPSALGVEIFCAARRFACAALAAATNAAILGFIV